MLLIIQSISQNNADLFFLRKFQHIILNRHYDRHYGFFFFYLESQLG